MVFIARTREREAFVDCITSDSSEFIFVEGRRGIGKTFFVNEQLAGYYAFDTSSLDKGTDRERLRAFHEALRDYGCEEQGVPDDWQEAFRRLRTLLDKPDCVRTPEGMRAVFLDELLWFDTPRSDCMQALSNFWYRWAQHQGDVKLIICSPVTWRVRREVGQFDSSLNHLVTRRLYLWELSLDETEEFLRVERGIEWERPKVIDCYKVFGGVPYYLNMLQGRLNLAQNINALCLSDQAPLRNEARRLLDSTLSDEPIYYRVLSALGDSEIGSSDKKLVDVLGVADADELTTVLRGLEECGYIRSHINPYDMECVTYYSIKDPFMLFSMRFMREARLLSSCVSANSEYSQMVAEGFVPLGSMPVNATPEEMRLFSMLMSQRIFDMDQRRNK